jgi:hypothetical protein
MVATLDDPDSHVAWHAWDYFRKASYPGMLDELIKAHAETSNPDRKARIIGALLAVCEGRHPGYAEGARPSAASVAMLCKSALAALRVLAPDTAPARLGPHVALEATSPL